MIDPKDEAVRDEVIEVPSVNEDPREVSELTTGEESAPAVEEPVKKISWLSSILIFFVALVLFLYIMFPYGVVKDILVSQIEKNSNFVVSIDRLGPSFPLGISAKDVELQSVSGTESVKFKKLVINVGVLSLLIGRLAPTISITDDKSGEIDVSLSLSYFGAIFGGGLDIDDLRSVHLNSSKFNISQLSSFGLGLLGNSNIIDPQFKPLIAPELKKIQITGRLGGVLDFDFDGENFKNTEGKIDLKLSQAELKINDENLKSLEQSFNRALLKGQMKSGEFTFTDNSGLQSAEMEINASGGFSLAQEIDKSTAKMEVALKMMGELNKQYGFLLDLAGGPPKEGKQKWKISGLVSKPNVVTL